MIYFLKGLLKIAIIFSTTMPAMVILSPCLAIHIIRIIGGDDNEKPAFDRWYDWWLNNVTFKLLAMCGIKP